MQLFAVEQIRPYVVGKLYHRVIQMTSKWVFTVYITVDPMFQASTRRGGN